MRIRFRIDGVLTEAARVPKRMVAGRGLADQDHERARHRREAHPAGRAGRRHDRGPARRPARHHPADPARRGARRSASSTRPPRCARSTTSGWRATRASASRTPSASPTAPCSSPGPTGSGKSTTLYAALQELNEVDKNIVTIEDPVEYRLAGVNQIGVHRKAGLTFATGLRSVLRADPDVIMVGEIRDAETARIAIEAALTGHMVLTTLHTNDAPGAITRLQEMGIESFLTSSAVDCVVAQRLARLLCPHCKRARRHLAGRAARGRLPGRRPISRPTSRSAARAATSIGYRGRIGIYSVMVLSERIKEMVVDLAPEAEWLAWPREEGMLTLREAGLGQGARGPDEHRGGGPGRLLGRRTASGTQARRPSGRQLITGMEAARATNSTSPRCSPGWPRSAPPTSTSARGSRRRCACAAGSCPSRSTAGSRRSRPATSSTACSTTTSASASSRTSSSTSPTPCPASPASASTPSSSAARSAPPSAASPTQIPKLERARAAAGARGVHPKPRGFVLVTGPTGSGKSTTLAAMIDIINGEREEHILTIEDPIEFLHSHKRCIVNQREIGADAEDFALALKAALREDPDVILVGEMRDLETMSTALTAAETGHLVFATLHTQSTAQTVDRIIDVFPAEQQRQVRMQLSIALQGDRHPAAAADRRRRRQGRRVRGAGPDPGRAQPDPRGQDPPDLLRDPDLRLDRDADDGRAPRPAGANGPDHADARRPARVRARGAEAAAGPVRPRRTGTARSRRRPR